MDRKEIFNLIDKERDYQEGFLDSKNTLNDWITYICHYATRAGMPWVKGHTARLVQAREGLIKAAAVCVAALEQDDIALRHYDED